MNNINTAERWSENVIIVDGDYIDRVAFDLTVNFERMLERRIPRADMARWLDCVALDGGLRPVEEAQTAKAETEDSTATHHPEPATQTTQVIFLHDKRTGKLENFTPDNYADDLNGKAFRDALGEFQLSSYAVEELRSKEDHLLDVLELVCEQAEVKRVMIVPDAETMYEPVRHALRKADEEKHITVFAMQPMAGGNFRQEILGYSLMQALGIRAEELK